MIITVGGIKGGSGKSTVATNLVVLRSLEGRDVLLVDADTQTTSSDFSLQRNNKTDGNAGFTCIKLAGQAVRTETLRLAGKYQEHHYRHRGAGHHQPESGVDRERCFASTLSAIII